jgi:hypothetical protein
MRLTIPQTITLARAHDRRQNPNEGGDKIANGANLKIVTDAEGQMAAQIIFKKPT